MTIKFLQAFNGDCILISLKDDNGFNRNILVDGGIGETYKLDKRNKGKPIYGPLKTIITNLKDNHKIIDLLILTHNDDDHIGGILKWFDDENAYNLVKEVWFNYGALIAEWFV